MIGHRLFVSDPKGNVFYLHATIFEIQKQRFIIKPAVCFIIRSQCFYLVLQSVTKSSRSIDVLQKTLQRTCFPVNFVRLLRTFFSQNTSSGCSCANLPNMNELKGVPHTFLLLLPEQSLCGTVPFQSNPFKLSIRLAIFLKQLFF